MTAKLDRTGAEPLDGNAIAGTLFEVFGGEMTTARGVCATCGAAGELGEQVVYLSELGAVSRCRSCGSVLIVLVTVRGLTCVDLGGLASLEAVTGPPVRPSASTRAAGPR
jgi:hypothetical protein